MDDEREWVFTFGVGDLQHAKCFVKIRGTHESARVEMVRRFGNKWGFQYDSEEKAGTVRWGLTEIPLARNL